MGGAIGRHYWANPIVNPQNVVTVHDLYLRITETRLQSAFTAFLSLRRLVQHVSLHYHLHLSRLPSMAHFLRGKQAGVQKDLSQGLSPDLFGIDDVQLHLRPSLTKTPDMVSIRKLVPLPMILSSPSSR
jgi:hypothetical protein